MEKIMSISSRLAGMMVGLALAVVGLGFMVLGVSLLPVIGILMGIPILTISWHFMNPKTFAREHTAVLHVSKDVMCHPGHAWARM